MKTDVRIECNGFRLDMDVRSAGAWKSLAHHCEFMASVIAMAPDRAADEVARIFTLGFPALAVEATENRLQS